MAFSSDTTNRHRVVIIGSGFGGLFAAQRFKGREDVQVTLTARTDHHLFQPLLYQVATGVLSAGDIAPPTREILRDQDNVRVFMGIVENIDVENKTVTSRMTDLVAEIPYDSLIVAADVKGLQFSGFVAWLAWLFIHLLFLVGFRSRFTTMVRWGITFLTDARSERATTHQQLVARLAINRLGRGGSAQLLRGEDPASGGENQN